MGQARLGMAFPSLGCQDPNKIYDAALLSAEPIGHHSPARPHTYIHTLTHTHIHAENRHFFLKFILPGMICEASWGLVYYYTTVHTLYII